MTISTERRDEAVSALTVYAVANRADVAVDHPSEPGGGFIEQVIVSFTDRVDNAEDGWSALVEDPGYGPDHDDWAGVVRDIVDGVISPYPDDIAETWARLRGWLYEDEVNDLTSGQDDTTINRLRTGLQVIAEQLVRACRAITVEYLTEGPHA